MKKTYLRLLLVACIAVFLYCNTAKDKPNPVDERIMELLDLGYTVEQVLDQVEEEFHFSDGIYGTGGIDGLLLDGTDAPNAISENGLFSKITKHINNSRIYKHCGEF